MTQDAASDISTSNIEAWMKHVLDGREPRLDGEIIERMASAVLNAMAKIGGAGPAWTLPESVAAMTRAYAVLLGTIMADEPDGAVRKRCKDLGRIVGNEALAFRAAAKRDGIRRDRWPTP